jgi:hypothetical protein
MNARKKDALLRHKKYAKNISAQRTRHFYAAHILFCAFTVHIKQNLFCFKFSFFVLNFLFPPIIFRPLFFLSILYQKKAEKANIQLRNYGVIFLCHFFTIPVVK